MMKNTEFVKAVAEQATKDAERNITIKDTKVVVKAISEVLQKELAAGNHVKAFEGIQFEGVYKDKRNGISPLTGEVIEIPAHIAPKAKFTKGFKEAVAGK